MRGSKYKQSPKKVEICAEPPARLYIVSIPLQNYIEFDFPFCKQKLYFLSWIWHLLLHVERFMWKSWKNHKYRFWLQKVLKLQKQYHFWTLWTLIKYEFHRYFSRRPALEGSTAQNIFFFTGTVLCGKAEKLQNTVFGYKKWSKFKQYHF